MDRRKIKRSGSVLGIVLCVMLILVIFGAGLLDLGMRYRIFAIRDASGIVARSAADAGMTRALYEMNKKLLDVQRHGTIWNSYTQLPQGTNQSLENCGSSYGVVNTTYSYRVDVNDFSKLIFDFTCTGTSNGAVSTISGTFKLRGLYDYALWVKNNIYLSNNALVDQYNNAVGDPSCAIRTESIQDGAITLKNNAMVRGDAVVGFGGDPSTIIELSNNAKITGSQYATTLPREFQSVEAPSGLPNLGTLSLGNNQQMTISSSRMYSSIDLSNNVRITIDAPVTLYVTGNISSKNNVEWRITSTGSLTLYLGSDFNSGNNSTFNNMSKDPKRLQICGLDSCHTINFSNNTDSYAVMYAPEADVTLSNNAAFRGAIGAKSFRNSNNGSFYYDASLRNGGLNLTGSKFVVKRWSESSSFSNP